MSTASATVTSSFGVDVRFRRTDDVVVSIMSREGKRTAIVVPAPGSESTGQAVVRIEAALQERGIEIGGSWAFTGHGLRSTGYYA
jgi:hypothetical protein